VFVESGQRYQSQYPESHGRLLAASYRAPSVACLPLVADARVVGAITFGFEGDRCFDADERWFLDLVAAHAAQALLRARTYERERHARSETALLYALLEDVTRADTLEQVYDAALDGLGTVLGVERSSILLLDDQGVMRFVAWRGISDGYRSAVEGHSPWAAGAIQPEPIVVPDTELDPNLQGFLPTFRAEGIRTLVFIPLVDGRRRLLGKFMIYGSQPDQFTKDEVLLAESIASLVAQVIARRLSEAETLRAYAEAERASQMKDEFLAVVSHELRTPLAAIVGWAAILKGDRANDPGVLAKGVEVIERNARAQTKIIEDILDVSRIVSGKLVLDARPVSLAGIVAEALDSVRASASAKAIELHFQSPEDPHSVVGDPERLRQIVWNLLSNAVKFTPASGHVTLRLFRSGGGHVGLEVTDTGRGIAPDFLPHVFERFRQADGSMTRRHGGLGLGLAIVRHLAELHGGRVHATSPGLDQGATFSVTFPVQALYQTPVPLPADDSEPTLPNNPSVDLTGIRVLLVDDEPDAREVVSEVLRAFGAEVASVDSVDSALETVVPFAPSVLVSDIGMPDKDGFMLVRRLRELDAPLSDLPVIALTAYARRDDARRVLAAGFRRFLSKPTDPATLATAVRSVVKPDV
jgi:signal transduction histidine kinase